MEIKNRTWFVFVSCLLLNSVFGAERDSSGAGMEKTPQLICAPLAQLALEPPSIDRSLYWSLFWSNRREPDVKWQILFAGIWAAPKQVQSGWRKKVEENGNNPNILLQTPYFEEIAAFDSQTWRLNIIKVARRLNVLGQHNEDYLRGEIDWYVRVLSVLDNESHRLGHIADLEALADHISTPLAIAPRELDRQLEMRKLVILMDIAELGFRSRRCGLDALSTAQEAQLARANLSPKVEDVVYTVLLHSSSALRNRFLNEIPEDIAAADETTIPRLLRLYANYLSEIGQWPFPERKPN